MLELMRGVSLLAIDALCGAGKTKHYVDVAVELALDGQKVLVVQPTTQLVDRTSHELTLKFPCLRLNVFHGKTGTRKPTGEMEKYLNETGPGGEVVVTTQETWDRLGHFPCKSNWNALFDEVPQVVIAHDYKLAHEHGVLTSHLDVGSSAGGYSLVSAKDARRLCAMAKNRNEDMFWFSLQPLTNALVDPNWATYVPTGAYQNLLAGSGKRRTLTAFSVRRPSSFEGFKTVRIAAARLEETFMYHVMRGQGAAFVRDPGAILRFYEHPSNPVGHRP
jgi:hypothetical protein